MKYSLRASHLALGVVLTSLAACSSSNSNNDQVQDDPTAVETDSDEDLVELDPIAGGDENESDDPDTPVTIDDDTDTGFQDDETDGDTDEVIGGNTDEETGGGADEETGGGTDEETGGGTDEETGGGTDEETGGGTDEETGGGTDEETGGGTDEETGGGTDEETGGGTDEETGGGTDEETGGGTDEETGGGTDEEAGILIPQVNGNSDLDRLIEGLTQQASTTLLDLNRRITQGLFISPLRRQCIGDFDAGLGEALTSIDCSPRTLTIFGINIAVQEAAFYNTDNCQASLFDRDTDACFLERISVELDAEFEILPGATRPVLVFPGADVNYAIGDTNLSITSIQSALAGEFSCVLDLTSNTLAAEALTPNCAGVIESVADQIEQLQDVE